MRGIFTKNGLLSKLATEKIAFPPKPDRQTYIQTYRRTDISVCRVASLLKINFLNISRLLPNVPLNFFEGLSLRKV